MDRTLVIQLKPTPEQAQILHRTLQEHTECFSAVARSGFASGCSNGVELHKQTYYPLRTKFPALPAQKAQAQGIQVVKIDPRHTSQNCSRCGHQARNNRRSQSFFLCRRCQYCLNADLNASYNIRDKYVPSLASIEMHSLL